MAALRTGLAAYRSYLDPETNTGAGTFSSDAARYRLLQAYTQNSVFEDLNAWSSYVGNNRLYTSVRSIYNPVARLVDFYVSAIYPGVLSADGKNLPDGVPLAIPLGEDTPDELKDAIAQFWAWSLWQTGQAKMVYTGASLGEVLVELIDEVDRGKVTPEQPWPGFVVDLMLDSSGNVKKYSLEYDAEDDGGKRYVYRKDVDNVEVIEYRDKEISRRERHGFGFCPAVWVKHRDLGGEHGAPAVRCGFGKLDELNSLASLIHDQIAKVVESPGILWAAGRIAAAVSAEDEAAMTAEARRAVRSLLKGPEGGSFSPMVGNLDLGAAMPYVEKLIGEIEADHPECVMYQELRGMSQVTGPAAQRLLGDVAGLVGRAAANYDEQSRKLFQMAVAISGHRLKQGAGAWARRTTAQLKFAPYDLGSYERGDLDFEIQPRPLLPETRRERYEAAQAQAVAVSTLVGAGVPWALALKMTGEDEEAIAEFTTARVAAIKAEQMLAAEDTIPEVAQ